MTDSTTLLAALILGLVEGLTEFLPVSSTGHLILAGQLLGFNGEKAKVFMIAIQLAAILAVVWEYRARFWHVATTFHREPASTRLVINLAAGFLPAAVLGLTFYKEIKGYLFNPLVVATALVTGGLLILWAERRRHTITTETVDELRWPRALAVGFAQALAMIPGTSRSGATIIGGLFLGLSRKAAAEFSFFLAVPTMFAATFYDLYRNWPDPPAAAGGREHPHHARGGGRVREAGDAVLDRQGQLGDAAPGAQGVLPVAMPPFPLLHVDTTWKFRDMYALRDRMAASSASSSWCTPVNPEAVAQGINPFDHGSACTPTCGRRRGSSRRSTSTASTRPSAAPAATRRSPGQGAGLLFRDRPAPLGPQEPAARAVEPLQRPQAQGRVDPGVPAVATGPSSTSGSTSCSRTSPSCRCTSQGAAGGGARRGR
jgi:undecaprenyl-diphosphatase